MQWKGLLSVARTRLHDKAEPYLWSDAELLEFANSAVDEACIRARFLRESVDLSLVDGTSTYTVPWSVVHIFDATFVDTDTSQSTQVHPVSLNEMYRAKHMYSGMTGRPEIMAVGDDLDTIDLYPVPDLLGVGTLTLDLARLPDESERLVGLGSEPVIPERFHRDLVYWIEREALSVPDIDMYDKNGASNAEANFNRVFGLRITARGEMQGKRTVVGKGMYPRAFGF